MKVEFCPPPHFATGARRFVRRAHQRGISFENKVLKEFAHSLNFVPKPWMRALKASWEYKQPDGLFFFPDEGRIVLIECKYSHTRDAFPQLRGYMEWLQHLFPKPLWEIAPVEVCRYVDPFEKTENYTLIEDLSCARPKQFSVFRFIP